MITIYYNNAGKILRPSPYVSIGFNAKRNKAGYLGGEYNITLIGTLLASGGSPVFDADNPTEIQSRLLDEGPEFDDLLCPDDSSTPPTYKYGYLKPSGKLDPPVTADLYRARNILKKQEAIRALFARDGQLMEISPITEEYPVLYCYPSVESINFEEGTYVNTCKYTVNLTAPVLYDSNWNKSLESKMLTKSDIDIYNDIASAYNIDATGSNSIYFASGLIEDFNDTWSLEPDDSFFLQPSDLNYDRNIPRMYRITRNLSAVGKVSYYHDGRHEAWENAKDFLLDNILRTVGAKYDGYSYFPDKRFTHEKNFGAEFLKLSGVYRGFNHVRTENIDAAAGSYSISDTWLLSSGVHNVIESYDLSLSSSIDSPLINVTLNGKIKGLTPTIMEYANKPLTPEYTNPPDTKSFVNAMKEYYRLSNDEFFGYNCPMYKRALAMTATRLHPLPLSSSVNINKHLGEIDYTITFNNRPFTFFSQVLSESINITDTYPGDVYAMIPVLNRTTGPLFQFIGGITQYERTLSIDFVVDETYLLNDQTRLTKKAAYLMTSPSRRHGSQLLWELKKLITTYSPGREPGIRKYILNPVSESWDAKNGKYSVTLSWIYELNQ